MNKQEIELTKETVVDYNDQDNDSCYTFIQERMKFRSCDWDFDDFKSSVEELNEELQNSRGFEYNVIYKKPNVIGLRRKGNKIIDIEIGKDYMTFDKFGQKLTVEFEGDIDSDPLLGLPFSDTEWYTDKIYYIITGNIAEDFFKRTGHHI